MPLQALRHLVFALAAERQADEIHSPHVAPGLRLPEDGAVMLLDSFQGQPQLIELGQQQRR